MFLFSYGTFFLENSLLKTMPSLSLLSEASMAASVTSFTPRSTATEQAGTLSCSGSSSSANSWAPERLRVQGCSVMKLAHMSILENQNNPP